MQQVSQICYQVEHFFFIYHASKINMFTLKVKGWNIIFIKHQTSIISSSFTIFVRNVITVVAKYSTK